MNEFRDRDEGIGKKARLSDRVCTHGAAIEVPQARLDFLGRLHRESISSVSRPMLGIRSGFQGNKLHAVA
jgi:hypothetical protein